MNFWTLDKLHERTSSIVVRFVWMTPELAAEILKTRNVKNRNMKPGKIRRLAQAIQSGELALTHQGIAFSPEGVLLDGQNRLQAISEAGVGVLLMVSYNVPKTAQPYMDRGSIRTDAEVQQFGFDIDVNRTEVSVAKNMIARGARLETSERELSQFIKDHLEAIRFARDIFSNRHRGMTSPVMACIARAFYHADEDKLRRFGKVFSLCPYEAHESAAAQLGKQFADKKNKRHESPTVFALTQRALVAFLKGQSPKFIRPLFDNVFPIPGESEAQAINVGEVSSETEEEVAPESTNGKADLRPALAVGSRG